MPKIRAILFDKDGTLLDFDATWLDFARQLALEAAGGVKSRSLELLQAAGLDIETGKFRSGSAIAAGTNADVVAAFYPNSSGEEFRVLVAEADRRSAKVGLKNSVPLPGVLDALKSLHCSGFRLGVATNDSTTGAEQTLLSLGVAHLFDATYGYDAVANPKPAPDVVHAFADTVGMQPSEVAMVGDNIHDLQAARAAGAGAAIGVLSGNSTIDDLTALADVVLDSVAEVPEYFAGK